MSSGRLIFDVTTLARAGGQAVGIVRACRELAKFARVERREAVFAINDTGTGEFRTVEPRWLPAILDGTALVDTSVLPSPDRVRRRERAVLPGFLRGLMFWIQHPRRRAIVALERVRLAGPAPAARFAGRLGERLLSPRYRAELTGPAGNRRSLLPFDMAAGPPVQLQAGDTLVFAGSEWGSLDVEALRRAKSRGVRIVVLIYDIIPLLFPHFYVAHNAESFRRFFEGMMPLADLAVYTAGRIDEDAARYGRERGLRMPPSVIVPLGADPIPPGSQEVRLPDGLAQDRYAIFVSTIEPRKNHALLLAVWKRLCEAGVPQAHDFKLVLVGRKGWLVDDLHAQLQAFAQGGYGMTLMPGATDATLGALYRGAAFGVYPSLYEGYGLPLVEMFGVGKTVLSSTGGALPEVAGEFAPCLDPGDPEAWLAALRRWIEDPAARAPYEAAIRDRFRHPTWTEAARQFFGAIDRALR